MIEIDVRASRDGLLVLSHDPRIAGVPVSATSWNELARLDLGTGVTPTTLPEVLEAVGRHPLNIELKHMPGDAGFDAAALWPLDAARLARSFDIVTCFYWPTVDRIRSELATTTGLLVGRHTALDVALVAATAGNHGWIMAEWPLVSDDPADAVAMLAADGLELGVWTVNDEEAALRLLTAGAGALITDDPIRMREKLEAS